MTLSCRRNPLAMPEDLLYGARDLEPVNSEEGEALRDVVLSTLASTQRISSTSMNWSRR